MSKDNNKLQQTKGKFKLKGIVTRLKNNSKAFDEDINERTGKRFRKLNFGIKTSEYNEIFVGRYDNYPEKVFLWNSTKRKEDKSYKGDFVSFDSWVKSEEKYREQGYTPIQVRLGFEKDDSGKIIEHSHTGWDSSKLIYENFDDGDSVLVEGELRYSEWINPEGKKVVMKNYVVETMKLLKEELDFNAEDFKEVTYFEQQAMYVDADHDNETGKTHVTCRIIDFKGDYVDVGFVVKTKDDEGNEDKSLKKLSNSLLKKVKFGDVLDFFGNTVNRALIDEEDDEDDDVLSALGGKEKPSHAKGVTGYESEFQIEGASAWDKQRYTDEDFVNSKESDASELGGKSNPLNDDSKSDDGSDLFDSDDDLDDDDLPFL